MTKYLVTGAAGFIGANFVKYILKKWGKDVEIVILDDLTYAGNLMTIKDEMLARRKGKPLPTGGKTVRVFSLEGEPLREYKLDHSVSGIWVMEEEGKMLALDVNSNEPIVEYTLR